MADNVTIPASGTGTATPVVSTDDVGGVHYQRIKVDLGGDGAASPLVRGSQTGANSLPVVLATDQAAVPITDNSGSLTVDGSVTANAGTNLNTSALALEAGGNLAGAATSLAVIDDWDESDRAKVNIIAGQAGIAGGTGVDGATVPRVTLATNVALPAGTNAIGKLAANSGVDIGDVDVTSVPADPFGANADAASATGSISAKLRFIASTGIPVTGTVTVGSHAVTNAGTFAVQESGSALTALQKIDDPVFVDDAAFTPATSSVMMIGAEVDDTGTDSVDEGDAGAVRMSANRNLYVRLRDNAGNERGLNIDANGALAATVTNATAANLLAQAFGGAAKDAPVSGNPVYVASRASAAAPTDMSADDDVVPFWLLRSGAMAVQPTYAGVLGVAGNGASGTGVPRFTLANDSTGVLATVSTVTTVSTLTGGGIAHDGADSGNPIKVGAKAITALSGATLVSSADRTDAQSDLDGALIVRNGYCLGDVVNGKASTTGTTVQSVLSAPGASTFLYVTDIVLANTGASTSLVTVQYDTAGTPTDLFYAIVPAGGGSNMHFDPPLKVPTANKDVGFKPATSSTTQYCSMIGFKSKL